MTDAALVKAYERARKANGLTGFPMQAQHALRYARYLLTDETTHGWEQERGGRYRGTGLVNLTTERGGFTMHAWIEYDEGLTLDDMGMGTLDEERGGDRWAQAVFASSQGYSRTTGDNANRWYHLQDAQGLFDYYRKDGASKATADAWVREAAERGAGDLNDANPYIIIVTAEREGIELGRASLGGYGLDPDDFDYDRQVATAIEESGMADEALDEARATLARLTEEQA